MSSSALFQEDSSSQEKEPKGTVCLLEQVSTCVVKSCVALWQWASPQVSEVCTQDAQECKKKQFGPCPLPSHALKALDFTLFCADGRLVVVRFVTTCFNKGSCV